MRRLGRRRFSLSLAAAACALGPARRARAADLDARIAVDRTQMRVGESVAVQLQVARRGRGRLPSPALPDAILEKFVVVSELPEATGSQVSFGHGGVSSLITRTSSLVLAPREAGTFTLSFSVEDPDTREKVRSNDVVLTVLAEGEEVATNPTEGPTEPRGDVFLWATTDKTRAYVGEQITYTLDVYERRRFLDVHLRTPPSFQDFFSEELPEGEVRYADVGGYRYRVQPGIKRALFAQRAGTATIGSAEIAIGLRRRDASTPIEIEVLPLPAEGQPPGFSPNNVGSYRIAAAVDRTEVEPGEPFTLTVEIEGQGNINVIDPGAWPDIVGARRYDPKVEVHRHAGPVVGGRRTYAFLVIAERAGIVTVPSHRFSFFDPTTERYQTVETEPIEVRVGGRDLALEAATDGDRAGQGDDEDEGEALAEIIAVSTVPRHEPQEPWLTPARWTYGMLAVPTLAAAGLLGGALWRRLGPDEAMRARARTKMRRRLRVEAAQAAVASGEGFHAAVSSLLHELAVERAGPEGVGLPRPELMALLSARGVASGDLRKLESLLDRCDAARFGAQRETAEARTALLEEALELARRSSLADTKGVA